MSCHFFLNSFCWLLGAYGITGPNEIISRTHFYVTVDKDKEESEILDDIRRMFDCEPKEYFELRREPKKTVKFNFLVNPSPGGGIVLKEDTQNPLRVPNDIVDEESSTYHASGTLTMFCFHNDKHYALTCFHVGIETDKQRFDRAFNQENLLALRKCTEWSEECAPEYCYRETDIGNVDKNRNAVRNLGKFFKGSFDSVSDIMSIEVDEDVQVNCNVAETDVPNWSAIWKELHKRVKRRRRSDVSVKKLGYSSNITDGYIDDINYTYKYKGELLFKDAVAVKSDSGTFLEPGDSGALIHFTDSKNKRQAFAYGVCAVVNDNSDVVFREEGEQEEIESSLFVCFRLTPV